MMTLAKLKTARMDGKDFSHASLILSCVGLFSVHPHRFIVIPVSTHDDLVAIHGMDAIIAYHSSQRTEARAIARSAVNMEPNELLGWKVDTGTFHAVMDFGKPAQYKLGVPPFDLIDDVLSIKREAENAVKRELWWAGENVDWRTQEQVEWDNA